MEHNRIDRLSQALANSSLRSRRGILAVLGVAMLGGFAGVDTETASAKKSRHHAKHKSRRTAKPHRHNTHSSLYAARSSKPDSVCEDYAPGDPCQEAICIDELTIQPACTCNEYGHCNCPAAAACPSHLACQKGACLTSCVSHSDCVKGTSCDAAGKCTVESKPTSCDCANLNFCSGHGSCTPECTCICDEGWFGAACDAQPKLQCSDHSACQECAADVFGGCVFCGTTVDGATGVCVTSDQCLIPQDGCKQ
jgi:hypothetical protein